MQLLGYNMEALVLVLATAVGAYGGFPTPPPIVQQLTQNEMVQWGLVFVLCYQGGSGQDVKLAALATVTMFALHKFLSN
ncbi:hypothetical protein crov240 [Cafeteria roenbergensis virus]|uniref:Uncharacterized protein n=1 Tax=Cafeteria roenbergensis virus (strain BV-PW1) TaxID=693272 RepID=E3T510_CROVB|nr:hypothetical protein crov240 [Cafeteria roenbergensis virus BV-PW1]ADO67273.1 hypothetical protein crov240 [Cafeteria roenbergensis virus BV-PW1]